MTLHPDEQARELPQLDNWIAEFSLTDESDVLDEFTLDEQAKIWGLMRTAWNTARERTAAKARLAEAEWWKLQIESRIHGINFYQHLNFDVADKIELERIASLRQAVGEGTKNGV